MRRDQPSLIVRTAVRRALPTLLAFCVGFSGASSVADDIPVIVFLGDSLTAGYGLGEEMAFPAYVGELLESSGRRVRVVNAGVSGDTTAGGLARLDWLLRLEPAVVVIGLGGNDGLRGLDLSMAASNLRQIVERVRAAGAAALLLGMRMPPNYGSYAVDFEAMYSQLADGLHVALVPFLLEGVGGDPELNLPDGIHPNAAGQLLVAENVVDALRDLLDQRSSG